MWRHPLRLLSVVLVPCLLACDDAARPGTGPTVEGVPATHGDGMAGADLAAVLGCGACHPGAPADPVAPPLDDLADRWEPTALSAYLQDPVPLREGVVARMPDFHLDPAEAAAVTAYLLSGDGRAPTRSARAGLAALAREHPAATAQRGATIVDALSCAGCHTGIGDARASAPTLAGVGARLRPGWLRDYLAVPRAVRPAGHPAGAGNRMPDFRLSAAEADSLAAWLVGAEAAEEAEGAALVARLSALRVSKAEALLRDHMSCLGCHRLGGDGGRVGPALDGVGERLRPDYLQRVVRDPAGATAGTIMPRPLEDSATLGLVVGYLVQGRPTGAARAEGAEGGEGAEETARSGYVSLLELEPDAPPPPRAGRAVAGAEDREAVDGGALYRTYCAVCHGARGGGDGFNAAHLPAGPTVHSDGAFMGTRPDATLFDGIHAGGHILGRSHRMPAFGGTLSAPEIRALVAHLRALCACDEPGWVSP